MGLRYLPTWKPMKINPSRRVENTVRPMHPMGTPPFLQQGWIGMGWTASYLTSCLAAEVLAQVAALKLSKKKVGNIISKHKAWGIQNGQPSRVDDWMVGWFTFVKISVFWLLPAVLDQTIIKKMMLFFGKTSRNMA